MNSEDKFNISNLRQEYKNNQLRRFDLLSNPFQQFENWFNEALNSNIYEPNAMVLSTVGFDGKPSSRMVLLKDFSEEGLSFYTNYKSKKGQQLNENPNASLLFYWEKLQQQIRIEGSVIRVPEHISDAYFSKRPKDSQFSAWISKQSHAVENKQHIEKLFFSFSEANKNTELKKPPFWGGFLLKPVWFEFWQGGEFRLHDRFTYTLISGSWNIERLYP
jgi:pyridoxamine 5'-phosphate oxidase